MSLVSNLGGSLAECFLMAHLAHLGRAAVLFLVSLLVLLHR